MRAFCALNLDVASARGLYAFTEALRFSPGAPRARWVPPTRMHVTLQFFGDIDVGLAPALREVIAPIVVGERLGTLGFSGLAGFPVDSAARVMVAMLDDATGAILRLARRVEEATRELGIEREVRAFRPHVTLARLAQSADIEKFSSAASLPSALATATEIVIYRSDFTSAGHEYAALARFPLATGGE